MKRLLVLLSCSLGALPVHAAPFDLQAARALAAKAHEAFLATKPKVVLHDEADRRFARDFDRTARAHGSGMMINSVSYLPKSLLAVRSRAEHDPAVATALAEIIAAPRSSRAVQTRKGTIALMTVHLLASWPATEPVSPSLLQASKLLTATGTGTIRQRRALENALLMSHHNIPRVGNRTVTEKEAWDTYQPALAAAGLL